VSVRLPRAIDITSDWAVLDSLTAALAGGPAVVVADGAGTAACDCAGVSALICAHYKAAAAGAQLRVVAAGAYMRRVITLTRADQILDLYPSVDEALAGITGREAEEPEQPDPALAGTAVEADEAGG
jgi:anti-anti-sigma regulatory factor